MILKADPDKISLLYAQAGQVARCTQHTIRKLRVSQGPLFVDQRGRAGLHSCLPKNGVNEIQNGLPNIDYSQLGFIRVLREIMSL